MQKPSGKGLILNIDLQFVIRGLVAYKLVAYVLHLKKLLCK